MPASPVFSLVDPTSADSDGPPSIIRFQPIGSFVVVEKSIRHWFPNWEQYPIADARRLWRALLAEGWAVV